MDSTRKRIGRLGGRVLVGALTFATLLVAGIQIANAAEIVPAVGLTRTVDGDEDARVFGSLGFRGQMSPFFKPEIGIAYRSEDIADSRLTMRMWPVTASLWFTPVSAIYAGGGVGWYHTTLDYDQDEIPFPIEDETRQEFGLHLGGGVSVPLGPAAALDLHGRYVMMREQESELIPENFDADHWMSSLGLAIKF